MQAFTVLTLALCLAACGDATHAAPSTGSTSSSSAGGGGGATSSSGGAGGAGGAVDKAALCTDTFGDALTSGFGRIDGTVLAVVKPSDTQCPMPNDDHVIIEVTMQDAVYRMVVNVQSTIGDPMLRFRELDHAMPAPAWAEDWHTGISFDYVSDLGVHADDTFTAYGLTELSDRIADELTIGQKISVYAGTSGGASAHNIHRNNTGMTDGAIVLEPDAAAPRFLLLHFANQTF
jgi:hypothetical protein